MQIIHLNPESMHRNPAVLQGVIAENPGKLVIKAVRGRPGVLVEIEAMAALPLS